MTVDVEDYFQVSAFDAHITRGQWDDIPSRLPANVEKILQIFGRENVKATFFTLGWVAERYPRVIRDIVAAGHELASHGHDHIRVGELGRDRFREDVESTRKRLEDLKDHVRLQNPVGSIGSTAHRRRHLCAPHRNSRQRPRR